MNAHRIDRILLMEELRRLEERLEAHPGMLPVWAGALMPPRGTIEFDQIIRMLSEMRNRRDAILAELGWLA